MRLEIPVLITFIAMDASKVKAAKHCGRPVQVREISVALALFVAVAGVEGLAWLLQLSELHFHAAALRSIPGASDHGRATREVPIPVWSAL
jgi:hypothetical protein